MASGLYKKQVSSVTALPSGAKSEVVPLFQQTIAEYTCAKRCGYRRSVGGANVALFHWGAAMTAALPLWIYSMGEPLHFPWYYFVSVLAGELLLVIVAGLVSGLALAPFTDRGTSICKSCGAPMFFAGRHFNPAGSKKPHWSDVVIFVVFLAFNVAVWRTLLIG